jgi:hypothetical protein
MFQSRALVASLERARAYREQVLVSREEEVLIALLIPHNTDSYDRLLLCAVTPSLYSRHSQVYQNQAEQYRCSNHSGSASMNAELATKRRYSLCVSVSAGDHPILLPASPVSSIAGLGQLVASCEWSPHRPTGVALSFSLPLSLSHVSLNRIQGRSTARKNSKEKRKAVNRTQSQASP